MRGQREPDPLRWMNKFYEFLNDPTDDTIAAMLIAHHELRKAIIEYYAHVKVGGDRAI